MRPITTYFIDTENVHSEWATLLTETRQTDRFILFYTVNSHHVSMDLLASVVNKKRRVECVMTDTGFNALDVTLIAELGRRVERDAASDAKNPKPRAYIVISDDKGYDPAIQHLARQGVQVSRTALHVTDRHRPQPKPAPAKPADAEMTDDKDPEPEPPDPKLTPKYSGIKEQWRQILLSYPGVTESDVTVCNKYLTQALQRKSVGDRMTTFHTCLGKYYKNAGLATEMYNRVKAPIRQIAENGPYPGKSSKK